MTTAGNPTQMLQQQFDLAYDHLQGKRWAEAETAFRALSAQRPEMLPARYNLGVALKNQRKLHEALEVFQALLAQRPDFPEACNNLGDTLYHMKRSAEAVVAFRRAVELRSDFADAWNNLGITLQETRQSVQAVAAYRRALEVQPDFMEAWNNLGNALRETRQRPEAIEAYRRALALRPDLAEAWNNLGIVLRDVKKTADAVVAYKRALELRPNYPEAWNNLGNLYWEQEQAEEAIDAYRRAAAQRRDYVPPLTALAGLLMSVGELDEALALLDRAQAIRPDEAPILSCKLCTLHYHAGYGASAIFREARQWNDRFARPLASEIPVHDNGTTPGRRLRIGYVSRDFHNHAAAMFLAPLLSAHNHRDFEIFCYCDVVSPDEVTARLRRNTDAWRDISSMTDPEATSAIRQDRIDILVDLALHTAYNRLLVFARKPAPVQVTWLGYPGTTGLDAIDYRLTDSQLDPPGMNDDQEQSDLEHSGTASAAGTPAQSAVSSLAQGAFKGEDTADSLHFRRSPAVPFKIGTKEEYYAERSVRLPDCFWCYDPRGVGEMEGGLMPEPSSLPALSRGHVTFGCLNNFCKVTDLTLALWAGVLAALPDSHLLLAARLGEHRDRVFEKLGLPERERGRVRFVARQPQQQYLATYRQIDICLDTLPCGGGTTSLDALWMGVPLVTRVGRSVVGRAGWSLLHNLGLMELVAQSDEQFVRITVELARNLDRLALLRATLRPRLQQSPLMDAQRFARNIEAAYRQMWQAWCAGRR